MQTDDPFANMQRCRDLLKKLDGMGWERSYHQRLFHDDFLRACTKTFYKRLPREIFARDHHHILVHNSWDNIAQEILVSTPRRFGKTISVSMFAAALIASCPAVEISIYSTCKRISQKLLRNVSKFVLMMADNNYHNIGLTVSRQNMEELVLRGVRDASDTRIVNSYPSKVTLKLATQKSKVKSQKSKVKSQKSDLLLIVFAIFHLLKFLSCCFRFFFQYIKLVF